MTRCLVVAPQPFFSPRGTPFSVYYRTLVTADLGVEVDLLTYGQGEDVDIPGVRIHRIPNFAFLGPVKVGPSYLKLLLDFFIVLWAVALLLRRRYDFVHAHEESVFFLRILKPVFGFKLVYDMHSSLPEQLRNYSFTSSRLLVGLFERLENSCLGAADAVITICPELARHAALRIPDPQRHFLIENSIFDEVRLKNAQHGAASPAPMIPIPEGRQLVLYAGTFEAYQGIDILIRAFGKALSVCPDAHLMLVGGNAMQVDDTKRLVNALDLDGYCTVLPRAPQAAVKNLMGRARVLVSPRTRGSNTPLKIYEQLASGIPLVATRILSHTQVLNDDVCFLVEPDPASLAEGLIRGLTDDAARARIVANAAGFYANSYARPVYQAKMRAVLASLGSDGLGRPAHEQS